MRSASDVLGWACAGLVMLASSPALAGGERFNARFDRSETTASIFVNGFESGGTCDWVSTAPCTLYIVRIPDGTGAGDHSFPPIIRLQVGAVLHIVNGDLTPHRIHANNSIGLPHQESEMSQGQEFVGTVSQVGSDTLYCHSHPSGTGTMTVIVE